MSEYSVFTSESVSEGHPDKMADQISDAVLDAIIKDDPNARVAVETLVKTGMAIVAGEVRTSTYVDLEDLIRQVILDIGYDSSDVGFDGASCAVLNAIGKQSSDIAMCVNCHRNTYLGMDVLTRNFCLATDTDYSKNESSNFNVALRCAALRRGHIA